MAVSESLCYPKLLEQLPSMEGKTVAVTGCTSGTGIIFAKTVAKLGAKVILLNRPSPRADSALEAVQAVIGRQSVVGRIVSSPKVLSIPCSLTSFASVKEAAKAITAACPEGLDVLCNNAGIMMMENETTEDGYNAEIQTNHHSHFLLTSLLWPLLEKAAAARGEARVVNHSSGARNMPFMLNPLTGHIGINSLYFEKDGPAGLLKMSTKWGGDGFVGRASRYGQTKLANSVFTHSLATKAAAAGSAVKTLVAHPGVCDSNLGSRTQESGSQDFLLRQFTSFATGASMNSQRQSQEDGTCGILAAACLPEATSGQMWGPANSGTKGPAVPSPVADDYVFNRSLSMAEKRLWDVSVAATGATFPF